MTAPLEFFSDTLDTPIGELIYACDSEGVSEGQGALRMIDWSDHNPRGQRLLDIHYGKGGYTLIPKHDPLGLTTRLAAYFAGDIHAIDNIPTATAGTPFQREVWRALREIPAAETISYGRLAERIGRPRAVRAVGLANGSNPVGVVVPCHRVIGANGSLTGYGGGLHRKGWLLAHERAHTPRADAEASQPQLTFA
jgi:methylated-DNA-[protein]-cysteine S-methyltransferase